VQKSPHKVHEFKMTADKTFIIRLVSREFDPYLRLEDSTGKQLAFNDDADGTLNSRIAHKASKDDTYRIIVTSFDGRSGAYTLTVDEATGAVAKLQGLKGELESKQQQLIQQFSKAKTEQEKDKIKDRFFDLTAENIAELCRFAKENAADPAGREAVQMVQNNLRMLAQGDSESIAKHLKAAAADAPKELQGPLALAVGQSLRSQYERLYQRKDKGAAKVMEQAETAIKQVAATHPELSKQANDILFELEKLTVGRPAMEIEAEDIDGKKFKLSDYKGKVVVLDFWGHW
jgi:predicted RNase H-like nuclease (RuvC/YqgF family)